MQDALRLHAPPINVFDIDVDIVTLHLRTLKLDER